jgi:hypothetical protein
MNEATVKNTFTVLAGCAKAIITKITTPLASQKSINPVLLSAGCREASIDEHAYVLDQGPLQQVDLAERLPDQCSGLFTRRLALAECRRAKQRAGEFSDAF